MVIPLQHDGFPKRVICECCAPQYYTSTGTTGHKWTREEIINQITSLSSQVPKSNWFVRGGVLRTLKHWTEKLERLNKAEEEFTI